MMTLLCDNYMNMPKDVTYLTAVDGSGRRSWLTDRRTARLNL